jgi:hypothetical protein
MFLSTIAFLFALSTTAPQNELDKAFVKTQIELKGMEFGMSEDRIEFIQKVVQCESNYQENAVGDKGKAYSYFQFWETTFNQFKKIWGHTWLDYDNPEDHIELGMWAFSQGYDKHWTCASIVNRL